MENRTRARNSPRAPLDAAAVRVGAEVDVLIEELIDEVCGVRVHLCGCVRVCVCALSYCVRASVRACVCERE